MMHVLRLILFVYRRFFTTHCEYVAAKENTKPKRPVRSRTSLVKSISAPIAVFKQQPSAPPPHNPTGNVPRNPQIKFVGPTPGGTLENMPENDQEDHAEGTTSQILTDTPMVSSSPKSDHVFLSPNTETSASHLPRLQAVDFATTSGVSPRGVHHQGQGTQLPVFSASETILIHSQVAGDPHEEERESSIPVLPPFPAILQGLTTANTRGSAGFRAPST